MKKLIVLLLLSIPFCGYSSIELRLSEVKNSYSIELPNGSWTAETEKNITNNGNDTATLIFDKLKTYTDSGLTFKYSCVNIKSYDGKQDSQRENISIEEFMPPKGKSNFSKLTLNNQYKVIFDNGTNKISLMATYSEPYNKNKSLGFSYKDTPTIKEMIKNGGNVSMTFNNQKEIINFDGYKEGYELMKECTN